MEYTIVNGELRHWGVKGMKWGVRRYQNKDGTLTAAGEKRYSREAKEKGFNQQKNDGTYYKQTKKGKTEFFEAKPTSYAKEDNEALKNVLNESKNVTNAVKNLNDISIRQSKKNRPRMDLSNMTDKEMRDQINRELLERQYDDIFNTQNTTKGREHVSEVLETTGSVLAIGASAVGLAVGILTLKEKLGV